MFLSCRSPAGSSWKSSENITAKYFNFIILKLPSTWCYISWDVPWPDGPHSAQPGRWSSRFHEDSSRSPPLNCNFESRDFMSLWLELKTGRLEKPEPKAAKMKVIGIVEHDGGFHIILVYQEMRIKYLSWPSLLAVRKSMLFCFKWPVTEIAWWPV